MNSRSSRPFAYRAPITKLSVVMPVFNEAETLKAAINDVLIARRADTEIELIIVESRSTDGSHEIVQEYLDTESVDIVFEDRPYGKGHAVRAGLSRATGEAIAIFDADGEYEFSDVWGLLAPLENGEAAFVLGSRHSRGQAVRQFSDHNWMAQAMNLMHWVFATMINLAFGTRLRDPFTMWKVFRSEILESVTLTADRFDLDWEIVGRFSLAGVKPLELPVRYVSRDYAQGKKVRLLKDPISWMVILFRIRFGSPKALRRINPSKN